MQEEYRSIGDHTTSASVGVRSSAGSTLGRHAMSTFSLRLANDDYEALQAVALLTGQPMAAIVRAAIGETVGKFAKQAALVEAKDHARREHALALLAGRMVSADLSQSPAVDSFAPGLT
jgi:predicted DNA-binding protein